MVTADEETIVRRIVGLAAPVNGDSHGRVWGPVTMEVATGNAFCRVCREPILRGEPTIRFGFDPRGHIKHGASVRCAYIHAMPCERAGEEDA